MTLHYWIIVGGIAVAAFALGLAWYGVCHKPKRTRSWPSSKYDDRYRKRRP